MACCKRHKYFKATLHSHLDPLELRTLASLKDLLSRCFAITNSAYIIREDCGITTKVISFMAAPRSSEKYLSKFV
jgi:hypothetical protein